MPDPSQKFYRKDHAGKRKMSRRAVGSKYEQIAKEWLKKQGLTILAQNFRSRTGEVDLIARR